MRAYPAVFKTKYEGDLWKKCFIFHFRDEKIGDMKWSPEITQNSVTGLTVKLRFSENQMSIH